MMLCVCACLCVSVCGTCIVFTCLPPHPFHSSHDKSTPCPVGVFLVKMERCGSLSTPRSFPTSIVPRWQQLVTRLGV
jgi:hypothetical protein